MADPNGCLFTRHLGMVDSDGRAHHPHPTTGRELDGLPWANLLKRSWAIDVFVCPRCAGPMRPIAVIEYQRVARQILEHLGIPARAPPRGRPQRPGQETLPFVDEPDPFEGLDPPSSF